MWIQQDLRLFLKLKSIDLSSKSPAEWQYNSYVTSHYPGLPAELLNAAHHTEGSLSDEGKVYLVQFKTQVLPEFTRMLEEELGGKVLFKFPSQSVLVRFSQGQGHVVEKIRHMQVVNWVGEYRPLYKFGEDVAELLSSEVTIMSRYDKSSNICC